MKNEPTILTRGEIWLIDWSPGRGSEQLGRRPALVIQNDQGNHARAYPNTIVAAISTKGKPFRFHVPIKKSRQNGLKEDSFVKCEQLQTVSKERLIGRAWGKLNRDEMLAVDEAVCISLGLKSH